MDNQRETSSIGKENIVLSSGKRIMPKISPDSIKTRNTVNHDSVQTVINDYLAFQHDFFPQKSNGAFDPSN